MKLRELLSVVGVGMLLLGLAIVALRCTAAQAQRPDSSATFTATPAASKGLAALDAAAKEGKYLFFFFWKQNDQQTQTMSDLFQKAVKKWAKSADSMAIQITDANEKPLIKKYGLSRAPMPLVLAIAPNGAVTGGFPIKFTEQELKGAFVSPCSAKCLKCLQDRKLVLLCVQGEKTENNHAAMQGIQAFKADERFAKATEIVIVNPEDQAETSLLQDLKVNPRTTQVITVVLAPPGQTVATFAGPVSKEQIIAKIATAQSGPCAGGKCGPGGCGPKK